MSALRLLQLTLVPLALAAGVVILTRSMRRMRLRAQFMVLLVMGVSIGFLFLAMVQLPQFPPWLGVSMMAVVITASPFAIRTFVRSLMHEDEADNVQGHDQ